MIQEFIQRKEKELNNNLFSLFEKHGVVSELDEEKISFPEQQMVAHCHIQDRSSAGNILVSVYVILETGVDQHIVESFAGVGNDMDEAVASAWQGFVLNTFHVLLGAFFSKDYDEQIYRKEINIQGRNFELVQGNFTVWGKHDGLPYDWLDSFLEELQKKYIPDGTHWLKIYYAQVDGKEIVTDVLLDNESQEDWLTDSWREALPIQNEYYAVRLFMVLQNKIDIHRLAATMAWMAEADDEQKWDYFIKSGVSEEDTLKAIAFIPMAFADVLMKDRYDVEIPRVTSVINDKKEVYSLDLTKEPLYMEAVQLATNMLENRCDMEKAISIFCQSATFNALCKVLDKGDDPRKCKYSTMINWPHYRG